MVECAFRARKVLVGALNPDSYRQGHMEYQTNRWCPLRLAVVDTHPIQYRAPLFRKLASRDDVEVQGFFSFPGEALGGRV